MREIVLDTETTGLDPRQGHRVVEIGCVELVNHVPTGRTFHTYIDPERDMPEDAFAVHGLSGDFLKGKPLFGAVADGFLGFVADAPLVIHNGAFDLAFLNAELGRIDREALDTARLIDTLEIARRRFPGAPASLDALCKRFGIDLAVRDKHGALVDCELLAAVYLELIGGRQPGLSLAADEAGAGGARASLRPDRPPRPPRPHGPSAAELAAHAAFLDTLDDPVWRR